MAPRVICNPQKLVSITTYLQKSKTCHSIKDLEKHLPCVASINGMQVKAPDYLQSLQDESKITVEKIGSGNWYWCFASDSKIAKEKVLSEARASYEKAAAAVNNLRKQVAEKATAHEQEEDSMNGGETREELMAKRAVLDADLKALDKELEDYRDHDPTELERKRKRIADMRAEADKCTDDIWSLEGWFSKNNGRDELPALRMAYYGDQWDSEECDFRPLDQ